MILADLNHLLTDVVLGAAGYGCASPPTGKRKRVGCRNAKRNKVIILTVKNKTLTGRAVQAVPKIF